MCGRFVVHHSVKELVAEFQLSESETVHESFNVAPSQQVPAIVVDNRDHRNLTHLRWGLIPSWSKDHKIGNRLINARAETVDVKPSFKSAFRKRRCILPVSGYYEWIKEGDTKQPYYFRSISGAPLALAGLWETWHKAQDDEVRSCTIITTESNNDVSSYHHRMPVILPQSSWKFWLAPSEDHSAIKDFLRPLQNGLLHMHKVSTVVNSPTNNTPDCLLPM